MPASRRQRQGRPRCAIGCSPCTIFDATWFREVDFRGCGFINAFGASWAPSHRTSLDVVRAQKAAFQE